MSRQFRQRLRLLDRPLSRVMTAVCLLLLCTNLPKPARADAAFDAFLQSQWPAAHKLGVSRTTFDAAIKGLQPDLSLPDLVIPGRPERQPSQPEFVLTPSQYLKDSTFTRLAAQGKALRAKYRDTLARIARDIGVPGDVVLAIWARETDYGRYKLPHDALQVLATQAYTGRRKDFFANEFAHALKMLQDGVPRSEMRSSWGGAIGLTQFLPSEFYKYGTDFDGDGKVDIWNSVPDALASAAKQLAGKGWQRGEPWAYEVTIPAAIDCTIAEPAHKMTIRQWAARGVSRADGKPFGAHDLGIEASLLMPEGTTGPAFLTPANYYVIKEYNYSDLYVLFVGHLADLIGGGGPFVVPWGKASQLRTRDVEAMQRRLTVLGFYKDKIDGKAGMLTRAALGAFQRARGLKVDCWPSGDVLRAMQ
jgi:lytic murein transglycosylase